MKSIRTARSAFLPALGLALAAVALGALVFGPAVHFLANDLTTSLLGAASLAGGFMPAAVAHGVQQAYEQKNEGEEVDVAQTLLELKRKIDDRGRAWEEFKKTNDQLLAAKAEGKAIGDLEAKLAKIEGDLDKALEAKRDVEDLITKLQRPGAMGGDAKAAEALAVEVKTFNHQLMSHRQAKGLPTGAPLAADVYTQYKSAVLHFVRTGDVERLAPEERKAMLAGSDPDGGFLLPASTVGRIVARVYEQSILRQLANVQTISSADLEGIIDNGEAGGGWVGETDSRPETDTPKVGKYRIEAHELYAEPRVTQKLLDDAAVDVEAWLGMKVGDKFARLEGAAGWQGNGVGKWRGICDYATALTGDDTRAWGVLQHVNTGAASNFHTTKADPLQELLGAFRDVYLQNATWVMRREVRTLVRKLKEATSDRYLFEPSLQAGQPDLLLGYPLRIDQYLPALADGSLSAAFGDFREAYTIVDRIGVRTLRDPFTAKPYVKFYSTKRSGGAVVNFEAVKLLRFGA